MALGWLCSKFRFTKYLGLYLGNKVNISLASKPCNPTMITRGIYMRDCSVRGMNATLYCIAWNECNAILYSME